MSVFIHSLFLKRRFRQPTHAYVRRVVKNVFSSEKTSLKGDLNIIFTDNAKISEINKKFLGHNRPTDVIGFWYSGATIKPAFVFGDIFISLEEAKRNAHLYGEPIWCEHTRLIIHGVLHLLGYTDKKPAQKKKMWNKQESLLLQLNRQRS